MLQKINKQTITYEDTNGVFTLTNTYSMFTPTDTDISIDR